MFAAAEALVILASANGRRGRRTALRREDDALSGQHRTRVEAFLEMLA